MKFVAITVLMYFAVNLSLFAGSPTNYNCQPLTTLKAKNKNLSIELKEKGATVTWANTDNSLPAELNADLTNPTTIVEGKVFYAAREEFIKSKKVKLLNAKRYLYIEDSIAKLGEDGLVLYAYNNMYLHSRHSHNNLSEQTYFCKIQK